MAGGCPCSPSSERTEGDIRLRASSACVSPSIRPARGAPDRGIWRLQRDARLVWGSAIPNKARIAAGGLFGFQATPKMVK
jgi:hypothetical protein